MNNNHEANGTFKSLTSGKELKDCILSSDMHGSQMYSQIKYSAQIDVRFGVNFTSSHICFNLGPPEVAAKMPLILVTVTHSNSGSCPPVCPGKTKVIFVIKVGNKNQLL